MWNIRNEHILRVSMIVKQIVVNSIFMTIDLIDIARNCEI